MKILKILFRWGLIFTLPIIFIVILINYTYDSCKLCEDDIHRHAMGPWLGIAIGTCFWAITCLLGFFLEVLYKYFRNKNKLS